MKYKCKTCKDCDNRVYILGKNGCTKLGHTIINFDNNCKHWRCEFCSEDGCVCECEKEE